MTWGRLFTMAPALLAITAVELQHLLHAQLALTTRELAQQVPPIASSALRESIAQTRAPALHQSTLMD